MEKPKEIIGVIKDRKLDQVRNKKSEHLGNQYWRLTVEIENEEIKEILVFKKWLEKEIIWEEIEQKNYLDKKYLLKVQRKPGAGQFFRLLNWELLDHEKN